jgi:formylglycine-generating enzyme required for sulfatase activity
MRLVCLAMLSIIVVAMGGADAWAQKAECTDCPEMMSIPPGDFVMGVPPGEEERERVPEKFRHKAEPQHRVTIDNGFELARYAVTRREFATFVRETGYRTGDKCWVFERSDARHEWKFEEKSGRDWRNPGFAQTDLDPVVCVSWNDAKAYVAWLSKKTEQAYRLPSEAEWEYAARAGSPAVRFWGNGRSAACQYANIADWSGFNCTDGYTYTAPVGSFRPNRFGLYDMLGNVWQWTEDCWNDSYRGAPASGAPWIAGDCRWRVPRGAAWYYAPSLVRAGYRLMMGSGARDAGGGFRVARSSIPVALLLDPAGPQFSLSVSTSTISASSTAVSVTSSWSTIATPSRALAATSLPSLPRTSILPLAGTR